MTVAVHWEVPRELLDDQQIAEAVRGALEFGGRAGIGIDVTLVDDPRLAEMHARYLGDPSPTDVMSFDLGEDGAGPAGEIVVSVDCAKRVAAERGVEPARELALYLVHGTLHLCGMDDHEAEERRAMRRAEAEVMERLGYAADPGRHD